MLGDFDFDVLVPFWRCGGSTIGFTNTNCHLKARFRAVSLLLLPNDDDDVERLTAGSVPAECTHNGSVPKLCKCLVGLCVIVVFHGGTGILGARISVCVLFVCSTRNLYLFA